MIRTRSLSFHKIWSIPALAGSSLFWLKYYAKNLLDLVLEPILLKKFSFKKANLSLNFLKFH